LPGTLVFDYPSIEAITSLVIGMMPAQEEEKALMSHLPLSHISGTSLGPHISHRDQQSVVILSAAHRTPTSTPRSL
jgi:hypothetical protein